MLVIQFALITCLRFTAKFFIDDKKFFEKEKEKKNLQMKHNFFLPVQLLLLNINYSYINSFVYVSFLLEK